MTTFGQEVVTCALCSQKSTVAVLNSTSTFGSPDLDLRPAELQRSTIWMWVQRCGSCGYCAASIADKTTLDPDAVERTEYRAQLADAGLPHLANSFLCSALLSRQLDRTGEAAESVIAAAWACDDEGATDAAARCRLQAVELLRKPGGAELYGDPGTKHVVIVDLLRRAGSFDEAVVEAEAALADATGVVAEVLAFSRVAALAGLSGPYTVDEARLPRDKPHA